MTIGILFTFEQQAEISYDKSAKATLQDNTRAFVACEDGATKSVQPTDDRQAVAASMPAQKVINSIRKMGVS